MKRYFRIFLNYFQIVLTERGRSFVWFLVSSLPPLIAYLYWRAVFVTHSSISGWTLPTISSYYLLLIIVASSLMAHIEEDVSEDDIRGGQLSSFILKPFSYFVTKLFLETPYRILQGGFACVPLFFYIVFFGNNFAFSKNPFVLILAVIMALLAYLMSFTFKMILGILTFWLTDAWGFYQLIEAIMFIFGGLLLPITLLPGILPNIARALPFAYMLYYPIIAFQGTQTYAELAAIIGIQLTWLIFFMLFYKWIWSLGIKKFTGVGN